MADSDNHGSGTNDDADAQRDPALVSRFQRLEAEMKFLRGSAKADGGDGKDGKAKGGGGEGEKDEAGEGKDETGDDKDGKDAKGDDKGDDKDGDKDKKEERTPEEKRRKKRLLIIGGIVLLMLIILAVVYWIVYKRGRIETDDAYTDGRAIMMAAKVGGYVTTLAVADNQFVHAGDLIVAIDPRDYDAALQNARGMKAMVEAQLESALLDLEIRKTSVNSQLESAQASRDQAKVALLNAKADLARQRAVNPLATTQQQTDNVTTQAASQSAQLRQAEASLQTAKLVPQNIAVAQARVRELEAQAESAKAQVEQAELNRGYAEIRAPQDGRVTRRNVEVGSYLQPGQALMVIVSPEVWVTANYKENQLAHMHVGQPVALTIDAFPSLSLHGHVDSFQMGSGSRFSAFPAENATGNFVKIVQRIPVKIVIDNGLDPNMPLPLGASVVPTVDVR